MPKPYFNFKEFTIWHSNCAAKVGTDGVLIGALAKHPKPRHILDIGTGSGLIALMLAQRFTNSKIKAIETEENAAAQASENAANSAFNARVTVLKTSLQTYETKEQFDIISCNPPYHKEHTHAPNDKRFLARHISALPPDILFEFVANKLSNIGLFYCIYPYGQESIIYDIAKANNLFLHEQIAIKGTPDAKPKRFVFGFGKENIGLPTSTTLVIEKERHQYTNEFKALVKDFYLHL